MGNCFRGRGGGRPGPGGELVDEVVAGEEEFVRGDLAGLAEGGGVGDGRPFVAEGGEFGVEGLHVDGGSLWMKMFDDGIRI